MHALHCQVITLAQYECDRHKPAGLVMCRWITNIHNEHVCSDEYAHVIWSHHQQWQFSINMWAGILGDSFVVPHIIPLQVGGRGYLNFLWTLLSGLMEDVPYNTHLCMWFQHDGAPPHYIHEVHHLLSKEYPRCWISHGHEAPFSWPACLPDLNPLDIFLLRYLKNKVCATTVDTSEEL
jgi:hypothetical protein